MAAGTAGSATDGSAARDKTDGISRAREPSLGELVGDITTGLSSLVRQEIQLAKAEVRGEVAKIAVGVGAIVGAIMALTLVLPLLSLAAVYALSQVVANYWAALIVAGGWTLVVAILGLIGALRLRSARPVPEQAIKAAKEDMRWLRDRKK
jgi:hypothetical protein